ncbi:MAG: hypothetical protein IIC75_01335 [Bacteroidetes bacterium]|nr:hypothetical protein [Bacteroidota bacterium]
MSTFMKSPRHRIFDYTPQFYKPEKDEAERKKKKLAFTRQLKTIRKRKRSPIIWIVLGIIILLVYLRMQVVG